MEERDGWEIQGQNWPNFYWTSTISTLSLDILATFRETATSLLEQGDLVDQLLFLSTSFAPVNVHGMNADESDDLKLCAMSFLSVASQLEPVFLI